MSQKPPVIARGKYGSITQSQFCLAPQVIRLLSVSPTKDRLIQFLLDPRRVFGWITRITRRALGLDFTSNGERVDIVFSTKINFDRLDMYQKSHLRRYQFASSLLVSDTIVGDIACGTGYGTVMMGATARSVNGYDISPIIDVVRKRYAAIRNVSFIQCDILQIKEIPTFDVIVSFETLEHFTPEQVVKVLQKFHSLLVRNGRLIISTPYNQEDSVASRVHHRSFNITEEVLTKCVSASHFTI